MHSKIHEKLYKYTEVLNIDDASKSLTLQLRESKSERYKDATTSPL